MGQRGQGRDRVRGSDRLDLTRQAQQTPAGRQVSNNTIREEAPSASGMTMVDMRALGTAANTWCAMPDPDPATMLPRPGAGGSGAAPTAPARASRSDEEPRRHSTACRRRFDALVAKGVSYRIGAGSARRLRRLDLRVALRSKVGTCPDLAAVAVPPYDRPKTRVPGVGRSKDSRQKSKRSELLRRHWKR